MTSSFGTLNTAYSGLVAARQGLTVTGDNIANANTVGYSRQTAATSAVTASSESAFISGVSVGNGVSINATGRINNPILDAQVRATSATSGYASTYSTAMDQIESSLNEPSTNGLSSSLQSFWSAWQNVATQAPTAASATTVIATAKQVIAQIADGYSAATTQWSATRATLDNNVAAVNAAAKQVAALNGQIRTATAGGGSANELMDQRDVLTTTIAGLAGGSVRANADGTVDVLLGGNAIVSGTTVHAIAVSGATSLAGATASPVTVGFVDNPAATTSISSGSIGAGLALLAPSNATGTGGAIAEAAQSYNDIATTIATTVNAIHQTGATTTGVTGLSFFALDPAKPAALGLSVVPTDASGIAAATVGAGASNGDIADKISQLTTSATGADAKWSAFVVGIGVSAKSATGQASLAATSAATASSNQLSESSVDTDQEATNMLTYQHAFEAAARVMTAVDAMLNTLINKTGLVGL